MMRPVFEVRSETEEVMRCLDFMAGAACLFHIKETTEIDFDLTRRLLAYTDGMTEKQVDEMHKAGGVLMTMKGEKVNSPFGGIRYNAPDGNTHMRIAKKEDDKLYLQWAVNGAPDKASISDWVINLSSGRMSFTCKETRRQQIKDYGRVFVAQDMTASGQIKRH